MGHWRARNLLPCTSDTHYAKGSSVGQAHWPPPPGELGEPVVIAVPHCARMLGAADEEPVAVVMHNHVHAHFQASNLAGPVDQAVSHHVAAQRRSPVRSGVEAYSAG